MRSRCHGYAFRFGLVLALMAWQSPAWAQQDEATRRARQLYERAEQSYSVGQFADAAQFYEQAYRIKALPGFLFNLGQCHRQLSQFRKARFFFRLYLERKPDSKRRATVQALIRDCDEQLLKVAMAQQQGLDSRAASQPATQPVTAAHASKAPNRDPRAGRTRKIVLWSGVGLSSALLVTAITTWAIALDKSNRFHDADTPLDEQERLKESGERLVVVSGVTLGIGLAVAAGTGLYYWLSARQPRSGVDVAAAPLVGGGLVLFRGDL